MLENADIGGYSVKNDILDRDLAREGGRLQLEDARIVDAHRLWAVREPRTLTAAYERFVGDNGGRLEAHDAGADVEMTVRVIEALTGNATAAECTTKRWTATSTRPGSSRETRRAPSGSRSENTGDARPTRTRTTCAGCCSNNFAPATKDVAQRILAEGVTRTG